jgi:hypothetical protein
MILDCDVGEKDEQKATWRYLREMIYTVRVCLLPQRFRSWPDVCSAVDHRLLGLPPAFSRSGSLGRRLLVPEAFLFPAVITVWSYIGYSATDSLIF